jgi:MFS family permease
VVTEARDGSGALRAWLIATLLAACYTLSYVDRQVISLLIEPIKASLHLSDTQFGLMQGVSFSLFYVLASLPLAWAADRVRRSRLMSACVAWWSVMTMLCGLAGSFWHLLFARIGVAAGEAGLPPAALATLSDRFDRQRLATATAMFMLAPFIGGGLALAGGGALYAAVEGWDRAALPFGQHLEPWQWVFVLIGSPGLIAALLLLLIVDRAPARRADGAADGQAGNSWRFIGANRAFFIPYAFAIALTTLILSSYVTWLPAAIMRSKAVDEATIGALFGPIYLVAGAAGTLSAGILIMLRGGADPVRAILRYMTAMTVLLWPIGTFGVLGASLKLELAMMGAALFVVSSIVSLSSLTIQHVTPPHLRARSLALLAMIAAMFGTGLGPVLAGVLSDHITFAAYPLSAALAIIVAVVAPLILGLLTLARRAHARLRLDLSPTGD